MSSMNNEVLSETQNRTNAAHIERTLEAIGNFGARR